MRISVLLFFTLLGHFSIAQRVTLFSGSGSAGIQKICFDEQGNRYFTGSYTGRPHFTNLLPDASQVSRFIAKMNTDNQVMWVVPVDDGKTRWEIAWQNGVLCVLATYYNNDREAGRYSRTVHLEKYSPDGALLSNTELASVDNEDLWITPHAEENGIILEATLNGEINTMELWGKTYKKTKYSTVIFRKVDYDGAFQCEYQIEGGFNGFTDLRVNDVEIDDDGNTYIASYFSESAELGIASYKTKIAFEGPIDLYEQGTFLLKIDNTGKAVQAKVIADYSFEIEKILVTGDQQIYFSAYYKGSDAYEKANPITKGNYMATLLLGVPLPDTKIHNETPSEDHVYALLDKDFNLVWRQVSQATGTDRARSMILVGDTLHICGMSDGVLTAGNKTVELVDDGYGDTFYSKTNAKTGEVLFLQGFTAKNSNIGWMFGDQSGNLMMVSGFKEPITIDGLVYQPVGSLVTDFIYEFNVKPGSSSTVTTTTTTTTSTFDNVSARTYAVGDHVRCDWKAYGKYYAAVITQVDGEKYLVKYASDGSEEWTTVQYLKTPEKGVYKVGDAVEGNWKGGGTWYPGKIGKVEGERYYIEYNDGDVEWTTSAFVRRP